MRLRDLVAVAVLGLLIAPPVASAKAAPIGGLVVVPGESIDLAAIRVRTSAGCPALADAYYATVRGAGFPAEGLVVTANTSAGLSHDAGFDVYFAQTMKDFADDNRTTLGGRYDVAVLCIDAFTQVSYGEFTGSLQFDTPTAYQALGTAKPVGPPPSPLPFNGGAPPLDPQDTAAPAQDTVAEETATGSAPDDGSGFMPIALIALAAAVPVAALIGYRGRRAR